MAHAPPSSRKASHITPTGATVQNICDVYLSRYIQDRNVRKILLDAGLIDTHGRVIDAQKYTPKSFMVEFQKTLSASAGRGSRTSIGAKRMSKKSGDFNTPYNTPLIERVGRDSGNSSSTIVPLPMLASNSTEEIASENTPMPENQPSSGKAAQGPVKAGKKRASISSTVSMAPHPPSDETPPVRRSSEGAGGKKPGRVIRIHGNKLPDDSILEQDDVGQAMMSEGKLMKDRGSLVDEHYNNFIVGARAPGENRVSVTQSSTTQTSPVKLAGVGTNTSRSFEAGPSREEASTKSARTDAGTQAGSPTKQSPSKPKKLQVQTSRCDTITGENAGALYAAQDDKQRVLNVVGRIRDITASELISTVQAVVGAHPGVLDTLESQLNIVEDSAQPSPAISIADEKSEVDRLKARVLELEEEVNLYEAEKVRQLCEKIQALMEQQAAAATKKSLETVQVGENTSEVEGTKASTEEKPEKEESVPKSPEK